MRLVAFVFVALFTWLHLLFKRSPATMDSAVHSVVTPLLRGFSRKNIFCQKIFDNFFSFQATEMLLISKWGRIQQEIQI